MRSHSAQGQQVERQLVAILAADIAGYSRLMGADEEGTLARLKACRRELLNPSIARHHARVVKTTGDGILIEFPSPVEAVRSAVEVQRGMIDRNADLPHEKRIEFRIGINVGDVIVEGRDLYGDAVNIAARLEGVAEPGGICISRVVRDHIRDKLAFPFADTGEQSVKNIARPVRVYALSAASIAALPNPEAVGLRPLLEPLYARHRVAAASLAGLIVIGSGLWWLWPAGREPSGTVVAPNLATPGQAPAVTANIAASSVLPRLSIVVLPFANLSAGPDQEYFAEGLTDNLTTDLSRISGSFVIARNTASTYKGRTVSANAIGRELGVRYVLEGTMQKAGNQVRVNAQLIDAQTGAHLWAERFDRNSADLMEMQDDITGRIANSLSANLIQAESDRALREHRTDPDAVDLTMRARALLNKPESPERNAEARQLFEQALTIDAKNVDALVGLASTYASDLGNDWFKTSDNDEWLRRPNDALTRALAIDPRNARAYAIKAAFLTYIGDFGEIKQAIDAAEMALALDANLASTYPLLGRLYAKAQQPERTAALVQQAMRLSPRDPNMGAWLYVMGSSQLRMGRYDEAIDTFSKSLAANPDLNGGRLNLTAAYLGAGRDVEARKTLDEARRLTIRKDRMPESPDEQILIMRVQLGLLRRGRWIEAITGWKFRAGARRVLEAFQRDENLPQTGIFDEATLARLDVTAPAVDRSSK